MMVSLTRPQLSKEKARHSATSPTSSSTASRGSFPRSSPCVEPCNEDFQWSLQHVGLQKHAREAVFSLLPFLLDAIE